MRHPQSRVRIGRAAPCPHPVLVLRRRSASDVWGADLCVLDLPLPVPPGRRDLCLVLPGAMNTPQFDRARQKLGLQPQPVPPIYRPEVTAAAVRRTHYDG